MSKIKVTDSLGLVHRDKDGNVVQSDKPVKKPTIKELTGKTNPQGGKK